MPIDFSQIEKAANARIAEKQQREQNEKEQIGKLNEYLDLKIAELLASEDKEVIAHLKYVLGNENDCISDALQDALVTHNNSMKKTPKLKFYLKLRLPTMQIYLETTGVTLRLVPALSFSEVCALKIDIDDSRVTVLNSKKHSDIAPIVFNPTGTTGIDKNWFSLMCNIVDSKCDCIYYEDRPTYFLFDYCKLLDMEKYVDIIRDDFSELGFRSVEIKHTDPEFKDKEYIIYFDITVDNPLYEEE